MDDRTGAQCSSMKPSMAVTSSLVLTDAASNNSVRIVYVCSSDLHRWLWTIMPNNVDINVKSKIARGAAPPYTLMSAQFRTISNNDDINIKMIDSEVPCVEVLVTSRGLAVVPVLLRFAIGAVLPVAFRVF